MLRGHFFLFYSVGLGAFLQTYEGVLMILTSRQIAGIVCECRRAGREVSWDLRRFFTSTVVGLNKVSGIMCGTRAPRSVSAASKMEECLSGSSLKPCFHRKVKCVVLNVTKKRKMLIKWISIKWLEWINCASFVKRCQYRQHSLTQNIKDVTNGKQRKRLPWQHTAWNVGSLRNYIQLGKFS